MKESHVGAGRQGIEVNLGQKKDVSNSFPFGDLLWKKRKGGIYADH